MSRLKFQHRTLEYLAYFMLSASFILFLFFIDEGNYSLKGIETVEGLIAFCFYLFPTFGGQLLIAQFNPLPKSLLSKILVNGLIGIIVGISAVFLLFSVMKLVL